MVSVGQVLVFALTAFVLIVVPGPSVLFTIGRALSVGRRAALLTVAGNAVGLCLQVAAVALGLGALVAESVAAFTALKLVGAAYLIYLGVRAIRHRRDRTSATDVTLAPARTRRVLWEGFVVGATNPR